VRLALWRYWIVESGKVESAPSFVEKVESGKRESGKCA